MSRPEEGKEADDGEGEEELSSVWWKEKEEGRRCEGREVVILGGELRRERVSLDCSTVS